MANLRSLLWVALFLSGPLGAVPDGAGAAAPAAVPTPTAMDAAEWREDLAVLREQLPKNHSNLFHSMSRAQFDAALDALEADLPHLNADQVKVGILRMVAMVNDGHTRVRRETLSHRSLPVRLHFFADGLYVVAADPAHADLVGGKVKTLGRLSADQAYAAVRPLLSIDGDNEGRRRYLAVDLLVMPEILHGLGATATADAAELTVEKAGGETSAALAAMTLDPKADHPFPLKPDGWVEVRDHAAHPVPLWLQHPDRHYWHQYLNGRRTLYVQYNQVADEPGGEPIAVYFPQLFKQAERRGIERLIIDVRLNGGGNNELNRPIWHALLQHERLNRHGALWVIIGPKTFSAAMNFVDDLEANTPAQFAGEPTGETPNMWGDPVSFTLPHSGILVQASTLWWQMADPRDQRAFRAPDLPAPMSFSDYADNVDPVMNAIMSRTTPGSPSPPASETAHSANRAAAH